MLKVFFLLFLLSFAGCFRSKAAGELEFLVKIRGNASRDVVEKIIEQNGLSITGEIKELGILKIRSKEKKDKEEIIRNLEKHSEILYVELDQKVRALK